jgi:hypothetical protein
MNECIHLSHQQLVRALDKELPSDEQAEVDLHLASCESCLDQYEALADLSERLGYALETVPVSAPLNAREELRSKLKQPGSAVVRRHAMRRWAWAAAACIGLALLFSLNRGTPERQTQTQVQVQVPKTINAPVVEPSTEPFRSSASPRKAVSAPQPRRARAKSAEISAPAPFIRLPYSDPSLPLEAADIVRVQMRLSTLANSGVIRVMPGSSDGWVQADVLLGMDGEPYGIRLVSQHGE